MWLADMPQDLKGDHTLPEQLLEASEVPWGIPNDSRCLSSRFNLTLDAMFRQMDPTIIACMEVQAPSSLVGTYI